MRKIFGSLLFLFVGTQSMNAAIVSEKTIVRGERAIQVGAFRNPDAIRKIERIFPTYDLLIRETKGIRKVYIVHLAPHAFDRTLRRVRQKIPGAFPLKLRPLPTSSSHPLYKKKKSAPVRVSTPKETYFVQVGTFSSKANAQKALRALGDARGEIVAMGNLYTVIIPGFVSLKSAKTVLSRLKNRFPDAFIALGSPSLPPSRSSKKRDTSSEKGVAAPVFKEQNASSSSNTSPLNHATKGPILKEETIPLNSETILKTRKKFY